MSEPTLEVPDSMAERVRDLLDTQPVISNDIRNLGKLQYHIREVNKFAAKLYPDTQVDFQVYGGPDGPRVSASLHFELTKP